MKLVIHMYIAYMLLHRSLKGAIPAKPCVTSPFHFIRARNSGLSMAKGHILEMAGKNKFELPSKKKMSGEIL